MGTINGVPAHEYSIETTEEKPWLKPGADITGKVYAIHIWTFLRLLVPNTLSIIIKKIKLKWNNEIQKKIY